MTIQREKLLTVRAATSRIPGRSGRGIGTATLWRWMTRGVRGVVLESVLIGGARYTSEEALERFFAAQNPGHVAQPSREAAIAAAERTLAAAGI